MVCVGWCHLFGPPRGLPILQNGNEPGQILKYFMSLKNNSSQLMLRDCCSTLLLFVSAHTTCLYSELLQYCNHSSLGICSTVYQVFSGKLLKRAWHCNAFHLNSKKICALAVVLKLVVTEFLSSPSYIPNWVCQDQNFCSNRSNIKCSSV